MPDLKTDPGREGTRLITALEKCWAVIQRHHPDVPPVLFITGTGISRRQTEKPGTSTDAPRRHYPTRGHHWADRWAVAEHEQRLAELFVAGETIKDGGEEILKTELHEAAHALAHVRKIQDTSPGDHRWHRKQFAELAREVGLEPPRRSEKPLGFSNCTLTDATRKKYAAVIRQLDAAALPGLGDDDQDAAVDEPPAPPEKPGSTNGVRLKVACGCEPKPRSFPVTPKILADGPIICGLCQQPFTLPGEEGQEDVAEAEPGEEPEPEASAADLAAVLPEPRPAEAAEDDASPMSMGR